MSENYEVVEVKNKETGNTQLIKTSRFNPEIHTLVGTPFVKTREITYSDKVVLDVETETIENKIDHSDLTEEKVKAMDWKQLKALAKSLDVSTRRISSELLQAQVIDKLFNNSSITHE